MPLVESSGIGSKDAHSRKVKFMCSHSGKIVPRPSDRKLRYAGGETRMISLPRHIHYSAFVRKMTEIYGPDLAVKYQLPGEDLDALVSVSCDEDLENMMDECDRLEFNDGSLKLRVFISSLFELEDTDLNDLSDPVVCERRYVNAVNALPDEAPFWRQDDCVPKDSSKSLAGVAVYAGQEDKAARALDDQLFEGLPLPKPAGDLPPMSSDLVAGFITNPVPSTSEQTTCTFENERLDVSYSHGPFENERLDVSTEESAAAELQTPNESSREEQPHLPQNEMQNGSMVLSNGLLVGNGEAIAASTKGMLVHLGSADMPYGFDSVEEYNRFDSWAHGDFFSSPGASLQKQLEEDVGLYGRPTVNESMRRSQSDGWYTQQHVLHQQCRDENKCFDRMPLYDPWTSLAEEHEQAGSTNESLPPQMPAAPDLQSFAQGSSSSSLGGSFASSTSPSRDHINLDGETGQASHSALDAALTADLESTKLSLNPNDRHWGNISLLDSDPLYGDISNPIFQTCYTTLPSSRGLHGCTLRQGAPVADLSDRNSNPFHDHDGGWHRDKALHFETQTAYPFSMPLKNLLDPNLYLHGESVGVGDRFLNNQPIMTMPSVTSEQLPRWASDPPLFDEPVHATVYQKNELTDGMEDSISHGKVVPPSSAMDNVSIVDMISDLLQSTQLKECLPAETSISVGSLDNLNAHDKEELTPSAASGAVDATVYMHEVPDGTSDELQEMQTVETILSRLGHPNSTITQLGAFDEEAGFHDHENSERDEVFSALASLRSCYETEAENWHAETHHMLQDASLVLERKVGFEETKPDEENADGFDSMSDSYVNTAAIAEAEAKAHGLQIIKNSDLEELRELGSGTFGTVYHGKWRGTDVAIKRIKSSCFMGKPTERERLIADFLREAYILGQLHHPNVVAFYGIVPNGPLGTLATVTEYMVNGSLKQVLVKKDRTLDRRKRLLIAMDAAFGMEYLHGKNVVHFDLKCENLLVNLKDIQRPICKVADLGLSKVKKQTMVSGGVRGTLPWMAPELLSGSSSLVSEKIDVFSFGIVMWELLTGEEPYANMHYGAIIGGIVNNTLRPPVPRWCDVAWRSLMEKCWAADPFERPTFSQIAASLRAMEASIGAKGQIPSSLL